MVQVEAHSKRPERRLIIRPGAIGDFIVSLPALEYLATGHTEMWTTETNLPLVRFADRKQSIISAGLDRLGFLRDDDVIARLKQFDSIVSWYGSNRPEFRELIKKLGLPFEFHTALPTSGTGIHAVDYYCAQVGLPAGAIPRFNAEPLDQHDAIVLHPFASSKTKQWPNGLNFQPAGLKLVRIRGPEEDLAGAIFIPDLFELARFLSGARAYIGNDSGITHLAAAVGVPTLALFGPTDATIWAPRGPRVKVIRAKSMSDIQPESVIEALRDFGVR